MYESKEYGIKFLRKITFLIGSFSFVLSLIIFIFADLIVRIVLGPQYTESVIILKILAFLPFIIGLSNIFAVQGLIAYGKLEIIPKITLVGAILNIFIALLLVNLLQAVGVAISVLIAEAVVTFISFCYFKRVIL
jgi:PST family polysaccharide transporter